MSWKERIGSIGYVGSIERNVPNSWLREGDGNMSREDYLGELKIEKETTDEYLKRKSLEDIEEQSKNTPIKNYSKERTTADDVRVIFEGMANLIDVKNERYGDSVMQPLGVFSSHVYHDNTESLNGVLIRLDDKLKRIKNSEELRKNDVSDIIGYLGFLCVEKGWTNFEDLLD